MTALMLMVLPALCQAQEITVYKANIDRAADKLDTAEATYETAREEQQDAKLMLQDAANKLEKTQTSLDAALIVVPRNDEKIGYYKAQLANDDRAFKTAQSTLMQKNTAMNGAKAALAQARKNHRESISVAVANIDDRAKKTNETVKDHGTRLTNVEAEVAKLRLEFDQFRKETIANFDQLRHLKLDEARALAEFRDAVERRLNASPTREEFEKLKADVNDMYCTCKKTCDARAAVVVERAYQPVYYCSYWDPLYRYHGYSVCWP